MAADYVTRHSITGEAIAETFRSHNKRYTGSHGRISDARMLLAGEMRAPLPDALLKIDNGEAFRVDTAQKYTSVMQLLNKLAGSGPEDEPELKRPKLGTSDLHERNSSRIERFINPAVSRTLSHRDHTELALVEGEGCALVVPEVARFSKVAGDYYTDAKQGIIKPQFRRNDKGAAYEDARSEAEDEQGDRFDPEKFDAEFGADEVRSRRVYDQHIKALRARNFPCDVELLSRLQYIPLNPRMKGPDVVCDGIISRTRMTASEAIRGRYAIPGLTDHLEPKDDLEGDMDTGDLWLYLAVLQDMDADGNTYPYFSYSLAGKPTQNSRTGFEQGAVIDLYKQCGLRTLPLVPFYGWRWFTVDADKRAMPYTFPFGRSWLAGDAYLTGKAYAGWSEGMLAWFMQMPDTIKDTAMQQAWLEFVAQNPMVIEPFKILPVWGNMIPAQHPGTGRDVNEMIGALQGSNSSEIVNPLARGGGDAASAIERTVISADTVGGVSDIQRSVLSSRRRIGEVILEVCCGIGRKQNTDVLIYGNPETPSDGSSSTRAIIELKPQWLGPEGEESFDLEAHYPEHLGDKLAEKAQLFGFWQADAITDEDWCQQIGVKDPDRYMAQLLYQRWKKTPPAMQIIMKDAAEYLGDKELIALFAQQRSGAAGPQGEPMGMLAGTNPPTGGSADPGAQAATGVQNPGASQYAAVVGAARNASVGGVQPVPQNGAAA